ncbi:hypothetical protein EXIGLDRAFT_735817 [Exidia glandulosa HHB12029]|uniref:Uncharacterized protein n=1 Tax=Exidia glandulosa HHB12029 TaxID=1314781 RepID=A0A165CP18_EXIGL|nr:hypothetical protein EXIGLDRAFT_729263 [Exidia glandulosa HHB12029]KZV95211.1 hypothetical protein EXIGLDRAFT_735817 [Exidia glandulosa HHB12029]
MPMQVNVGSRSGSIDLGTAMDMSGSGTGVGGGMVMRGPGMSGDMVQGRVERAGSSASEGSNTAPRVWQTNDQTRFSRWTFDDAGFQATAEDEGLV